MALELFQELAPLSKIWFSQATITVARDPELEELAGRSGRAPIFIGLESLSEASLGDAAVRGDLAGLHPVAARRGARPAHPDGLRPAATWS